MQPISEDYQHRTVFKSNTGLRYSQNCYNGCMLCYTVPPYGAPQFLQCSGCRAVQFCCREHQLAFWPRHRSMCREVQRLGKLIDATSKIVRPGLPPLQERKLVLEDWVQLQSHVVDRAIYYALELQDGPRARKRHVTFEVKYRSENQGNPSNSFSLESAVLVDHTPGAIPAFDVMQKEATQSNALFAGSTGFVTAIPCYYMMDNEFSWMTVAYIYEPSAAIGLNFVNPENWFATTKYFVDRGIVFRDVADTSEIWKPGYVVRKGTGWVWERKEMDQLMATFGIPASDRHLIQRAYS